MNTGLVSIIIPTYNRCDRVHVAIDSALSQTYAKLEVVVVDDGSTDRTRQFIVEKYAGESRVKYHYKENGGVSSARNTGIEAAQGEFIAFLDSDDWWKPWKLELQVACLARLPQAGMIWSNMSAVGPEGDVVEEYYLKTMYDAYRWFTTDELFDESFPNSDIFPELAEAGAGGGYQGDIFSQMIMGNLVHTSTVLLRRDRVEKVGLFNLDLKPCGEDYEFHLRTCREGPVAFVDLSTIYYQIGREDQLTRPEFKLAMACNFPKTIDPVLSSERDSIHLPDRMIKALYRDTYQWIGDMAFMMGERSLARTHILKTLRYGSRSPRNLGLLLLLFMPEAVESWLRKILHRPKEVL
jgi:glycosyltransferase involved in cell wall biosynthesis